MKYIFYFVMIAIAFSSTGQNLVPNPSFEDTVSCPYQYGQIDFALGWNSFGATPDYFNPCDQSNYISVPSNSFGFQLPRTGNAYAGMLTYEPNGTYREYLGCQLDQPLVVGQKYFVSYWTVLSDKLGKRVATNKQGAKFSTIPYSFNDPIPTNNTSPVLNDSVISDTLNWIQVKGTIIADSAFSYFVIGSFFDDAHIDTTKFSNWDVQGYYYVDAACVSTDSLLCFQKNTSLENENLFSQIHLFPNPVLSQLEIDLGMTDVSEIQVINILGQAALRKVQVKKGERKILIDCSSLMGTTYLLILHSSKKNFVKKFMKIN